MTGTGNCRPTITGTLANRPYRWETSRADKTGEQREVPLCESFFTRSSFSVRSLMMEGESKQELQTEEKGREGGRKEVRVEERMI